MIEKVVSHLQDVEPPDLTRLEKSGDISSSWLVEHDNQGQSAQRHDAPAHDHPVARHPLYDREAKTIPFAGILRDREADTLAKILTFDEFYDICTYAFDNRRPGIVNPIYAVYEARKRPTTNEEKQKARQYVLECEQLVSRVANDKNVEEYDRAVKIADIMDNLKVVETPVPNKSWGQKIKEFFKGFRKWR